MCSVCQLCEDCMVNLLNWNTRLWQHYEHKVKHLNQYHCGIYVCHSVLGMPTTCFFMWHYMWSEIPHCQCCDHMVKHIVRYIPHCGICVPLCVRGMPTTCLFMWYFLRSQIHTVTTLWPHGKHSSIHTTLWYMCHCVRYDNYVVTYVAYYVISNPTLWQHCDHMVNT